MNLRVLRCGLAIIAGCMLSMPYVDDWDFAIGLISGVVIFGFALVLYDD